MTSCGPSPRKTRVRRRTSCWRRKLWRRLDRRWQAASPSRSARRSRSSSRAGRSCSRRCWMPPPPSLRLCRARIAPEPLLVMVAEPFCLGLLAALAGMVRDGRVRITVIGVDAKRINHVARPLRRRARRDLHRRRCRQGRGVPLRSGLRICLRPRSSRVRPAWAAPSRGRCRRLGCSASCSRRTTRSSTSCSAPARPGSTGRRDRSVRSAGSLPPRIAAASWLRLDLARSRPVSSAGATGSLVLARPDVAAKAWVSAPAPDGADAGCGGAGGRPGCRWPLGHDGRHGCGAGARMARDSWALLTAEEVVEIVCPGSRRRRWPGPFARPIGGRAGHRAGGAVPGLGRGAWVAGPDRGGDRSGRRGGLGFRPGGRERIPGDRAEAGRPGARSASGPGGKAAGRRDRGAECGGWSC